LARAPNQKAEQAKAMYLSGQKLIEIARKLQVPEGTVRRWKSTYRWENERSDSKANVRNPKSEQNKQDAEVIRSIMENSELTDRQRLFCVYYSKTFNATRAYQKAYGGSYETALTNGPALLGNTRIRNEVLKLKKLRYGKALLEPEDIVQKYMDIAFADLTDYVSFGREQVPVMGPLGPIKEKDPDTGESVPVMREVNVVRFQESKAVDGTILAEVKQGKNGASIKLADRMKALYWLAEHMDLATEEQRARIDKLRAETVKLQEAKNDDSEGQLEELIRGLQDA